MDKSMKLFNAIIENISKKRKAITKESIKHYKKRQKLEKNKLDKI
jgi:hypothetical protein